LCSLWNNRYITNIFYLIIKIPKYYFCVIHLLIILLCVHSAWFPLHYVLPKLIRINNKSHARILRYNIKQYNSWYSNCEGKKFHNVCLLETQSMEHHGNKLWLHEWHKRGWLGAVDINYIYVNIWPNFLLVIIYVLMGCDFT
jgi:hypothetical protein